MYVCESIYDEVNKRVLKGIPDGLKAYQHSKNVVTDEVYYFRNPIVPQKVGIRLIILLLLMSCPGVSKAHVGFRAHFWFHVFTFIFRLFLSVEHFRPLLLVRCECPSQDAAGREDQAGNADGERGNVFY